MSENDFEIQIMDDPDFEDLIAEILYKGELCFLMSQEEGFDRLTLQVHPQASREPWEFTLAEMMQSLEYAKNRLWDLRRVEEPAIDK